ncbi:MAG: glycosyltransferase [Oligoflexia bacterium]|nr:glycosyltransferase [Oligoflexia bacterium]MBF0364627.1 glycosyltransferase [Oligoflexia bacterium]
MISIVTITYNNYQELKATLYSIKEQLKNFESTLELIVINGGSCCESKRFLSEFANRLRVEASERVNILVVNESDRGISDAFNKGVHAATGDAIMLLNSGDLLVAGALTYFQYARKLETENETAFLHADVIFNDGIAGKIRMAPRMCEKNLGQGMPYWHQTMIVRRRVWSGVGEFKLAYRFGMDYEWVCRLLQQGYRGEYWGVTPVVLMDGGGVSVTRELQSIKECFRALKENHLLTIQNIAGLVRRTILYFMRRFLIRVGAQQVLSYLKRKKYKQR